MTPKDTNSEELAPKGNRGGRVRLLSIPEVAHELGLSEGRIYGLIRRRLLPAVRIGRQVRVDSEQLDAWINTGGRGLENG